MNIVDAATEQIEAALWAAGVKRLTTEDGMGMSIHDAAVIVAKRLFLPPLTKQPDSHPVTGSAQVLSSDDPWITGPGS